MSKSIRHGDKYETKLHEGRGRRNARRLSARALVRTDPDITRIARAVVERALAEAESEAQATSDTERPSPNTSETAE